MSRPGRGRRMVGAGGPQVPRVAEADPGRQLTPSLDFLCSIPKKGGNYGYTEEKLEKARIKEEIT